MSILATVVTMIQFKSDAHRLVQLIRRSREEVKETAERVERMLDQHDESPECNRRVNPDRTRPGERRRIHLREVPK